MTLRRLEWARLVRTRRLVLLVGVYVFFGLTGPLMARYLGQIIDYFGADIRVEVPEAVPADGLAQFNANAGQLGVLVVVIVAAGALTLDALPQMAMFLRTRVSEPGRLLWPRFAVVTLASAGAYLAGVAVATYQTWALIGALPAGRLAGGAAAGALYLGFIAALTAVVASRTTSVLATVAATVAALVALAIVGVVDAVGRWLPSRLVGALDGLARGADWADHLPATAVTAAVIPVLLYAARDGLRRREL